MNVIAGAAGLYALDGTTNRVAPAGALGLGSGFRALAFGCAVNYSMFNHHKSKTKLY